MRGHSLEKFQAMIVVFEDASHDMGFGILDLRATVLKTKSWSSKAFP
jgi:hypothetical protein